MMIVMPAGNALHLSGFAQGIPISNLCTLPDP